MIRESSRTKTIRYILIALLVVALCAGGWIVAGARLGTLTDSLFDTYGLRVDTGVQEEGDARKGMRFTVTGEGAYAAYADKVSGVFSLTYGLGEKKPDALTLTVTEESGRSFDFILAVREGRHTVRTEERTLSDVETDIADAGDIVFDANTMRLTAGGQTVIDLTAVPLPDGQTFRMPHFAVYSVKLSVDGVLGASFTVYSVNDVPLSEKVFLKDEQAPSVYAPSLWNGVVQTPYELVKPYAYDVIDGNISDITVTIFLDTVQILTSSYSEGMTFIPESAGAYTVRYTATDSAGNAASRDAKFTVFDTAQDMSFSLSDDFTVDGAFGINTVKKFPAATVNSPLARYENIFVSVTVYKDGEVVSGYDGISADVPFAFTFAEEGEYQVEYRYALGCAETTLTYEYDISAEIPTLVLREPVAGVQTLNKIYRIPDADLTYDGITKPAAHNVVYPSGAAYSHYNISLTEYGVYEIVYYADFADGIKSVTEYFRVYHDAESLFVLNSAVTAQPAEFAYDDTMSGVLVTELAGSTGVQFVQEIDFSEMSRNEPFIELIAQPGAQGVRDYNNITVTLTDTADPSNQVDINIIHSVSSVTSPASYVRARHSGYTFVGIENASLTHIGDSYGRMIAHSFSANMSKYTYAASTIRLYMNYAAKTLHAGNLWQGTDDTICDLTGEYFPTAWNGFTDGKAYVSVKANNVVGRSGSYLIMNIAGYDLSGDMFTDYNPPEIRIDCGEVPDGVVGTGYTLFDAAAEGAFGTVYPVTKRVYYNYGLPGQGEINVRQNRFVPDRAGVYVIEYSAQDGFGNRAVETCAVTVTEEAPDFQLTVSAPQTAGQAGRRVELPEASWSGNSGDVTLRVFVTGPDSVRTEISDGYFLPVRSGTYTVDYEAEDYLGFMAEDSYTVEVTADPEPLVTDEIFLLPVYVAGRTYMLPELNAYVYGPDDPVTVMPAVTVAYADGTTVALGADRVFTPEADTGTAEDIVITYTFRNGTEEVAKRFSSSVASFSTQSGSIKIADYFVKRDVTVTAKMMETLFEANADNASFLFAKPIIPENFSFKFNVPAESNNFTALQLTLTDTADPSVQVTLKLINAGGDVQLEINENGVLFDFGGSFAGEGDIIIYFVNSTLEVFNADYTRIATITSDSAGRPFSGFAGEILFGARFIGVTGPAVISAYNLSDQSLNSVQNDFTAPFVKVLGTAGGIVGINEPFTVSRAVAGDVLGEIAELTVTVRTQDGAAVAATDGTVLNAAHADREYTLVLADAGRYSISYTAVDTNGQESSTSPLVIYVMDIESPSIRLDGTPPTTGKIGDSVKLPGYVVADNGGAENCRVQIMLINPLQTAVYIESLEFTPDMTGTWTVRYIVYDAFYNYAMSDVKIDVR